MRKLYIFGLIVVACIFIGQAYAEEFTMSTYYPAPYGVYREFTTTYNTYLARDGGSVGIGTTNPSGILEVAGGTAASGPGRGITLQAEDGGGPFDNDGGDIILLPGSGYGTGADGNVGIGTTNPEFKLAIRGDSGSRVVAYVENTNAVSASAAFSLGANSVAQEWELGSDWNADGGDNFYIWGGGTGDTRLFIDRNGNVGIGVRNPITKLDVAGRGTFNNQLNIGGSWAQLQVTDPNIDLEIVTYGTGDIYLNPGNNVGIGTASPGYTLTVSGTAWCTSGVWAGSDIRWKENVETLTNPLEKVLKLRGVRFDWKREEFKGNNFPEGRQIGIIAQELEKEFPELVTTDGDGYKAIAYDRLTAVLLEAIKAQQGEIETLKREVGMLKMD